MLAPLVPSLWRHYRGDEFILELTPGADHVQIPQSYYYRHTPGHNPLIVNRFIEPFSDDGEREALTFTTSVKKRSVTWHINFPPVTETNIRFSSYRGRKPLAWTRAHTGRFTYKDTAYWIMRCPKAIIGGHNDIWSQAAMDTYAALHRIASGSSA